MNVASPDGYQRPEEFAATVGVPVERVRAWIRDGRLPAVRLGRVVLIPTDAIKRLLATQGHGRPSNQETSRG